MCLLALCIESLGALYQSPSPHYSLLQLDDGRVDVEPVVEVVAPADIVGGFTGGGRAGGQQQQQRHKLLEYRCNRCDMCQDLVRTWSRWLSGTQRRLCL